MPPCHTPNSSCNSVAGLIVLFVLIFLKLLNYYLKTIKISELSRTAFGW